MIFLVISVICINNGFNISLFDDSQVIKTIFSGALRRHTDQVACSVVDDTFVDTCTFPL